MAKDMVGPALYDYMHDDQCPICEHMVARTKLSMEHLLYEGVNNLEIRKSLYDSKGFCSRHSHMLAEMGDPLAHAIIYYSLIDQAVKAIEANKNAAAKAYQNHKTCMFCTNEKTSEEIYILAFVQAYEEKSFADQYRIGGRLCIPHLAGVLGYKKGAAPMIVADTLNKYKTVQGHLSEIMRKNDYQYIHEALTEDEKLAWKDAVDLVKGKDRR